MKPDRITRLLELLMMLQSDAAMDIHRIADELGISRRTVFRDLNVLKSVGVPFDVVSNQGYRISSVFFFPPTQLKASEAMGLMMLLKLAWNQKHHPFVAQAIKAIRKMLATAPPAVREVCSELIEDVSVFSPRLTLTDAQMNRVSAILHAIGEHRVIECICHGTTKKPQQLRIKPYHLSFSELSWYVIAENESDQFQTLSVSNLSDVKLTEDRFTPLENFSIAGYLGKAWRLLPEGTLYNIELVFSRTITPYVTSTQWHPSQQYRLLPDRSSIVTFEVDGLSEITHWIWGFGEQVTVKRPMELRNRITSMCRAILQQHKGRRDGEPPVAQAG